MHISCYNIVIRVHMVDLFRLEMEDMEMKHNSALKQLMREFNTQMALKEKELEGSVKETIGKKNM